MNRLIGSSTSNKRSQKHGRSQINSEIPKLGRESPYLLGHDPCAEKFFQTQDNREILFTDPGDHYELKKSKTKNNLDRVHFSKTLTKPDHSTSLLKDQDDIIKLQNSIIDNLRSEISVLGKNRTDQSGKFSKVNEDFTQEFEKVKKTVKRKEEVIKEMRIEMDINSQKSGLKVQKLELAVEKIKGELAEMKKKKEELQGNLDKEVKVRTKNEAELVEVKGKLRVVDEENKILIQNYEEVRRRFFEVDKQMQSIKSFIARLNNTKVDPGNVLGFIEHLAISNKNLTEKVSILNEKTSGLEKESMDLKQTINKYKQRASDLKSRLEESEYTEALVQKLREKIFHLKQKLSITKSISQKAANKERCSSNEYLPSESQLSLVQEELGYLKTENRALASKESELNHKLKSSEKARYYYQEQTIALKEKVNYLENQLKMIEFSVQELKAQNESPVKQHL